MKTSHDFHHTFFFGVYFIKIHSFIYINFIMCNWKILEVLLCFHFEKNVCNNLMYKNSLLGKNNIFIEKLFFFIHFSFLYDAELTTVKMEEKMDEGKIHFNWCWGKSVHIFRNDWDFYERMLRFTSIEIVQKESHFLCCCCRCCWWCRILHISQIFVDNEIIFFNKYWGKKWKHVLLLSFEKKMICTPYLEDWTTLHV